jgi:hypothetical protein
MQCPIKEPQVFLLVTLSVRRGNNNNNNNNNNNKHGPLVSTFSHSQLKDFADFPLWLKSCYPQTF